MVSSNRVFRSDAWIQAWIDTWGTHPNLRLVDVGGRAKPQEILYLTKTVFKKIIPANTLCLAGVGCGPLSTPRAEYNDISTLINAAGDLKNLSSELKKLPWNYFYLADVLRQSAHYDEIHSVATQLHSLCNIQKRELAYSVSDADFEGYLAALGPNTRLAYFNRRQKLMEHGEIVIEYYPIHKARDFFALLNQFHVRRWGVACYSEESQRFLINFMERLQLEQGKVLLEVLRVNNEIVSVLFDVIYHGRRYNFQSGYAEHKFPKVALGAIHMGYAIQSALESNLVYDFMAGEGKHSNYKSRIANSTEMMETISIERGIIKGLRKLYTMV